MAIIIEYSYAVGSIYQIRTGNAERRPLPRQGVDFKKLLPPKKTLILPEGIGIYQEFQDSDPKNKEDSEKLKETLTDLTKKMIEQKFHREDPVHQNLILVGYNSESVPRSLIIESLEDIFQRIAVHPIDSIPDVYKKDTRGILSFMGQATMGKHPTREKFNKVQSELTKLLPKTRELLNRTTSTYGLNRDEWFSLISMFPF